MWNALRTAVTGAQAQQRVLDVTANNLANAESIGYKSFRAALVDLEPETERFGVESQPVGLTVDDRDLGRGAMVSAVLANDRPGAFQTTNQPLDLAINGQGYFAVRLPDGGTGYTRAGALRIDGQRRLTTGAGNLLVPAVVVPAGATEFSVGADGEIKAGPAGQTLQPVGRLALARFVNPDGLEKIGESLFAATAASGDAIVGTPGSNGLGTLVSGALEASNVDTAEEYTRIIQAQRAYQANLRSIRAIDEMLQAANNLRIR